ncbi:hypothetical protein ACXZ7E_02615 [Paenibacillus lautus]
MFGNSNRGSQGLNLDSALGSGAGLNKMTLSILMEMLKNMDADTLEGLRQSLNDYGPYNSARTASAAAKTPTHYTEQERVKQLESMRTSENSRLVDEAVAAGEDPGAFALRLVKSSLEQDEATNEIIAEMNRLVAERSKPVTSQPQASPAATGDEDLDALVAEIIKQQNGRTS